MWKEFVGKKMYSKTLLSLPFGTRYKLELNKKGYVERMFKIFPVAPEYQGTNKQGEQVYAYNWFPHELEER